MQNAQQPKKTNWGMIILILILIPILILGTIFGYNYITQNDKQQSVSNNNLNSNNQNSGFPITGDWYFIDNGMVVKYIIHQPQTANGELKGKIEMLMDGYSKGGAIDYVVVNNYKLQYSDPQYGAQGWDEYVYNDNDESLTLTNDEGNKRTFYRSEQKANNKSSNNNYNSNNNQNNNSQPSGNPQLKAEADKFTRGKWQKYDSGSDKLTIVTFSSPQYENGYYVGESVMESTQPGYCATKVYRKYYIMPGNRYKTDVNRITCDGQNDNNGVGVTTEWVYEFFVDNNGNQSLSVGKNDHERNTSIPYTLL